MSRKTSKKASAKADTKKRAAKQTNRRAKRKRDRLPFPPALAKRLGFECEDLAAADIALHNERPRLRKTLQKYCEKYSELGAAWERGQLLRNLKACAGAIMTVSQAAKLLGFEHGRALRELLDTDGEVSDLWEQTRIHAVARAKTALATAAEGGNQAAIKAMENFLYDEGEGARGGGNINYNQISVSQAAELFGVSRQAIFLWYTKHGMPRNADKTINLREAIAWFERFTKAKVSGGSEGPADTLRDLKAEEKKMDLAHRRHELLDRAEVMAGYGTRWQKITASCRYKTRELAALVHNQTVDRSAKILEDFFSELQSQWLEVPEFLQLEAAAGKKFAEVLDLIKTDESGS